MSAQRDPELDDLLGGDPELIELAELLRSTPHPAAGIEPTAQFRMTLRRRLMRQAWEHATKPQEPWYRRSLRPRRALGWATAALGPRPKLAWAGAAAGALLVVFAGFTFATANRTPASPVTVTSPLDSSQTVAMVTPIELKFNQPMDTASVQQSVRIEPAIVARYTWTDNNQRLVITPVHDLTANTRYDVTVSPTAKTQSGQAVAKPHVVSFVTASPAPTATPTPTSTPTSTPSPVLNGAHQLAPAGPPAVRWSADGTRLAVVSPTGQLAWWPLAGGSATTVAPDGVTLVAIGPDGSPAYVRNGQLSYDSLNVSGVQPLALGFHGGSLEFATASDVETSSQQQITTLNETATAAEFSPAGDRLAYRGASGLHIVDLTAGKDVLVGPATGLGDWSPDGHRYAYPTATGVQVADTTTGLSSPLFELPNVAGLTWSRGNQILVSTTTSVYLYGVADGTGLRKLQDGVFGQPLWAQAGGGTFAYRQGGEVWVARLVGALAGAASPTTGASQDDLVTGFMTARRNQLADQAESFLDAAGQAAFAHYQLIYADPSVSLSRYYVLLSQPGHVVVRLVLTRGSAQAALDETLTIQRDATGRPWIHGVTEAARNAFGAGPEIVRVVVTVSQVQVYFDSDLDPTTVQAGVTIRGQTTQAAYDSKQKMVTLTVAGGLTPGQTYDLLIGPALQDVQPRPAVTYDLSITGPATT